VAPTVLWSNHGRPNQMTDIGPHIALPATSDASRRLMVAFSNSPLPLSALGTSTLEIGSAEEAERAVREAQATLFGRAASASPQSALPILCMVNIFSASITSKSSLCPEQIGICSCVDFAGRLVAD
jgi:hypothetical protein